MIARLICILACATVLRSGVVLWQWIAAKRRKHTPRVTWAPQVCTEQSSCPRCGAKPGERCATDRPLHLERWDAWQASGWKDER